jgi:hypothetical protein
MKNKYADMRFGTAEAVFNKLGGVDGVAKFLQGELVVTEPSPSRCLKSRSTTDCPKIGRFVAKDNFGQGKTINGVKFYDLGDNFKKIMLPMVEGVVEATTLQSYELLCNARDLAILKELPSGREVTTLGQLHHQLTLQGEGQEGALLANGYANIFYVVGADGNLWAVGAYWGSGRGWSVCANPVGYPNDWDAVRRVFSR